MKQFGVSSAAGSGAHAWSDQDARSTPVLIQARLCDAAGKRSQIIFGNLTVPTGFHADDDDHRVD
jgi:hypothetical protein